MIQTIKILITDINKNYNALIIYDQKIMYFNEKEYLIDDKFISRLLSIIFSWDEEYGYDNKIDTQEFQITINATDGQKNYHGKGFYPHNYDKLIELLGELNG